MKKAIFHIPYKIDKNRASGTNVRPLQILHAFSEIGYEMEVVRGEGKERSKTIKRLKKRIRAGEKFDFLYSESSTLPTLLTEAHHYPIYPCLDFSFFQFCKQNQIPIGLFYRDIHWNFDDYVLKGIRAVLTKQMYYYDLRKYASLLDTLFLPSLKMQEYIPQKFGCKIEALPSGHISTDIKQIRDAEKLTFFYVGGVDNKKKMHKLFIAFSQLRDVRLIFCTRQAEWEKVKHEYVDFLTPNIEVHHKQGAAMKKLMAQSNIAMLFYEHIEYRKFAMPVKLFEYFSEKLPIICSGQSAVGDFVKENDIGWTIEYREDELIAIIERIHKDKSIINQKIKNIEKIKEQHTWMARARQVVESLVPQ